MWKSEDLHVIFRAAVSTFLVHFVIWPQTEARSATACAVCAHGAWHKMTKCSQSKVGLNIEVRDLERKKTHPSIIKWYILDTVK